MEISYHFADSVEGVDITVSVYQFAEKHYLANQPVVPAQDGGHATPLSCRRPSIER